MANKFNVVKTTLFTLNTLKLKVKIDMHIEQCNVVVIIKYEIKSMKTLEDYDFLKLARFGHYTGTLRLILCEKCSTSAAHFFAAGGEALLGALFSWSC